MITYQEICKNEEISALIARGNQVLKSMGFTEHSKAHAGIVAERAAMILEELGHDALPFSSYPLPRIVQPL